MHGFLRSYSFIQALLFCGLTSLSGQTLLVRVIQEESGQPIPGAFLSFFSEDGTLVRNALTNSEGRFLFRAGSPGSFRVRAEMIGREGAEEAGLTLGPGETRSVHFRLPVNAIQLEGIVVEAEERCRLHPERATGLAMVWEEARKALRVQEWADQEGLYRFRVVDYERDMDVDARQVERETRQVKGGVARSPIRSLPAKELMEGGFIQGESDGGWTYFGPDATALLSDEFLDTHCFHLRSDPGHPGFLGLAFEPVQESARPDIRGTLWLDRETAALQFLEFGYTWAEYQEAQGVAGGRVEFEALPNGAWIVRRWWIRMPILSRDLMLAKWAQSDVFVSGVREAGSVVEEISTLDRQRITQVERGSLTGLVWDSTRAAPLEGANVYLSGTSYSAVTDAEGGFLLENIPEGFFLAAFTHPRLDALGVFASSVEVAVTPGDVSNVSLGIPALGSLLPKVCREEESEGVSTFLTGVVRDQSTLEAVPQARVIVRWQEVLDVSGAPRRREARIETFTNSRGRYITCGFPAGKLLVVQADFMDQRSDTVHARVLEGPFPVVDLRVGLSQKPPLQSGQGVATLRSTPVTQRRTVESKPSPTAGEVTDLHGGGGTTRVAGRVTDFDSGVPLSDVQVRLMGYDLRRVTDAQGQFLFEGVEAGRFLIRAELLGRATVEDSIQVAEGALSMVEIQMPVDPISLDEILVSVEARNLDLDLVGFYDRREYAHGIHLTEEEITDRHPLATLDLLEGRAGIRIIRLGLRRAVSLSGSRAVSLMSDPYSKPCWPAVWLDGQLLQKGGGNQSGEPAYLDELVNPSQIGGLEIYNSTASVPVQFNVAGACGVILIWTKRD